MVVVLKTSLQNAILRREAALAQRLPFHKVTTPVSADHLQLHNTRYFKDKLEAVLQSENCPMPNYMELIPKNATTEEKIIYLKQLFEESKFFSRELTCEKQYGKNFKFAHLMSSISKKAANSIKRGDSFDTVLSQIANGYSGETLINSKFLSRIGKSGIYRGSHTKPPMYMKGVGRLDFYTTGYAHNGSNGGYSEYIERLNTNLNRRDTPFEGFTLTKKMGGDSILLHPYHEEVAKNMDIVSERYKIFQSLVNEYNKTGKLTPEQRLQADDIISEIYYLMANTCPFKRGSNGICDVLMRSQYDALGIKIPHVKKGVGLDLEAFTFELKDYKKNWRAFFEGGPTIKLETYKNTTTTLLKPLPSSIKESDTIQSYIKDGLIRKEFFAKVESAKTIEECKLLANTAISRQEMLLVSMRMPKK